MSVASRSPRIQLSMIVDDTGGPGYCPQLAIQTHSNYILVI